MATMKEYGLIFEENIVKVVEVVIVQEFKLVMPTNDMIKELNRFIKEHNLKPIAIIPDTAWYGGDFKETKMREATLSEKKEYIFMYKNDDFDRYKVEN